MYNILNSFISIAENQKISITKLEHQIGASKGVLSRAIAKNSDIQSKWIMSLVENYPQYNTEWILTGKGSMLKSEINDETNTSNTIQAPQIVTIDSSSKDNIVLVPVHAQAGYLNGYADPEFIENLPTYNLPNLRNGIFRMFEVKGHSMLPTLHQGSYIVGQFVENWKEDMKDDRIYIIVSAEDGVVVKRCLNRIEKYESIFCKSDNRAEFPSYQINPRDVKEIWEVKLALLSNLPNPADLFNRINDLEAEMIYLKESLAKQ